ncbi:MAG: PAS domain-containing protein [Bacteroidota bacterium]
MNSLAHILIAIQDIANDFDGSFALKNAQGKYFYANDNWLKMLKLESPDLMGKTDEDIFPPESAAYFRKTDLQALEKQKLITYSNTTVIHGQEITYLALKWVVRHKTGEVFCFCTMGDLVENSDKVLKMQPKIQQIIEKSLLKTT